MKNVMQGLLAAGIVLGASGVALVGDEDSCALKTLHGSYLFAARGFTIVAGVAQPKAIVEVIDFDGDGAVSVPSVTLSVNGSIVHMSPGASGTYTLEEDCTGTIELVSGTTFDIVTSPRGNEIWMIQTNQNNVFQGTATRNVARSRSTLISWTELAGAQRGPGHRASQIRRTTQVSCSCVRLFQALVPRSG